MSTQTWIPATWVAREYHTRIQNVYNWVNKGLIPGVFVEPISGHKRIPRTGLIIFFGRQLLESH
jgi:hypothetical protein